MFYQIKNADPFERKLFLTIFLFFATIITVNISFILISIKTYDGLVEENYYKKGLNYQKTKEEQHTQAKLDLKVDFKNKNDVYTITVLDKNNEYLEKSLVTLNFFRPTESGFDKEIILKEKSKGVYENKIAMDMKGIWDVFIEIKKGDLQWKSKKRIKI
ncbi:MAG: FixH family protein [Cyanobacteriota bacterium]